MIMLTDKSYLCHECRMVMTAVAFIEGCFTIQGLDYQMDSLLFCQRVVLAPAFESLRHTTTAVTNTLLVGGT